MTAEQPNCPDSIPEMVHRICVETSDKYVSEPIVSQITENLLQGLKQFKNSIRWKEFWHLNWLKELLAKGKKLSIKEGKDDLDKAEEDDEDTAADKTEFKGLGT
eukprot:7310946-Ditylum_brightwellii.AAC.1